MDIAEHNITTVGQSPAAERSERVRKYVTAMSLRFVCIAAMPFVEGLWLLVCAAGAVLLPYAAVVIANVKSKTASAEPVEGATLALTAEQVEVHATDSEETSGTPETVFAAEPGMFRFVDESDRPDQSLASGPSDGSAA